MRLRSLATTSAAFRTSPLCSSLVLTPEQTHEVERFQSDRVRIRTELRAVRRGLDQEIERLGTEHALVVYGKDGMDEVSLGAATLVGELKDGEVREYEIHPEDFGLTMASNRALRVETPAQSKAMLEAVLANEPGALAWN